MTHPVLHAINQAIEAQQEDGMRQHLGASIIGRECARQVWYSFRWAKTIKHAGRLLRLFNRGHREEERFVAWLRDAGIQIETHDPATGEQWRIFALNGHFGGSLDGLAWNVPGVEQYGLAWDEKILTEFKTHGDKSFKKLVSEGVKKSKPEHYAQMQTYMKFRGLRLALYLAINKNDDEIYAEFVPFDAMVADMMIGKASHIIPLNNPPPRITEDPSWFSCRFCDFKAECHQRKELAVNCRTCIFSVPTDNGEWRCSNWNAVIPLDVQKVGCNSYKQIGA